MQARAPLPLHRLHDEEVVRLLESGERRQELTGLLGAEGYRELSSLAREAAASRRRGGQVVYVLPGLMGSRIGTRGRLLDDVIWLDPIEVAAGHLTRLALPRGSRLSALGVMLLNALKLRLTLQIAGFDARFHAYDWRRSVERLADELLARIESDGVRSPMLVGHSMGGVVARVALAADRGRIARAVQLGAPNSGSFAPVLAMRGVYPTVRKLAALDLRHDAEDLARIVFRTLPSLHELLPDADLTDGANLFDSSEWPDDALRPDPELLADAASARRRWPASDPRCLHVVGVRQETAVRAERRGRQFRFHYSDDGDGTVPRVLAVMPESKTWFATETHGGLPNNGRVISAVVDLLREGTTGRLPASHRAATRKVRTVAESTLAPGRAAQGPLAGPVARRETKAARAGGVAGVPRRRVARRASPAGAAGRSPVDRQASDRDTPQPGQHRGCERACTRARRVPQRRSVRRGSRGRRAAGRCGARVHAAPDVFGPARRGVHPARPAQRPARGVRGLRGTRRLRRPRLGVPVVRRGECRPDAGACAHPGFRDRAVRHGVWHPRRDRGRAAAQGNLRRPEDRGPRSCRPARHDLRDRPAQVHGSASRRRSRAGTPCR